MYLTYNTGILKYIIFVFLAPTLFFFKLYAPLDVDTHCKAT